MQSVLPAAAVIFTARREAYRGRRGEAVIFTAGGGVRLTAAGRGKSYGMRRAAAAALVGVRLTGGGEAYRRGGH